MQPTARKFGNAVRKCLKENDFLATVKGHTTSFSGFGYGDGLFADISSPIPIPDDLKGKLLAIRDEFEAKADEDNHFIIGLVGAAYPFGGQIKKAVINSFIA